MTGAFGQLIESEHDASLPCCLQINAAIDDQRLSISLSRSTPSALPDRSSTLLRHEQTDSETSQSDIHESSINLLMNQFLSLSTIAV